MQLLPEWAPQEAVILAWPDEHTDWQPWLREVREVYLDIIATLNQANTPVILLIKQAEVDGFKASIATDAKVGLVVAEYNDTWVRDYAFLSCKSQKGIQPVEFIFNGWGNKFDARLDNLVNRTFLASLCNLPLLSIDTVAEGGALEIDQEGHLLSTSLCLLNPERNGLLSLEQYQEIFKKYLGANAISILGQGHLEGDDTDGHIDTLVRFTPEQGLVIQSAFNRPDDSHCAGLKALVSECQQSLPMHTVFELPLPNIVNEQGERLPASYANYLISNQIVLCPVYQQAEDRRALEVIQAAYPQHRVCGINCLPLVQQFGSLHCISMQIPRGTLRAEIVSKLNSGVSIL